MSTIKLTVNDDNAINIAVVHDRDLMRDKFPKRIAVANFDQAVDALCDFMIDLELDDVVQTKQEQELQKIKQNILILAKDLLRNILSANSLVLDFQVQDEMLELCQLALDATTDFIDELKLARVNTWNEILEASLGASALLETFLRRFLTFDDYKKAAARIFLTTRLSQFERQLLFFIHRLSKELKEGEN